MGKVIQSPLTLASSPPFEERHFSNNVLQRTSLGKPPSKPLPFGFRQQEYVCILLT